MDSANNLHKIFAKTTFLGKEVVFLPSCHSTNDIAQQLVSKNNFFEGTLVCTDHQTAGRGQRGNNWLSEANKNLTFSIILKPRFLPASDQFYLNMAVSNAIITAFTELGVAAKIKWPNDILIDNQKVGGILIENNIRASSLSNAIVGIGINVNQHYFPLLNTHFTPTSLCHFVEGEINLRLLLESILLHLEAMYLQLKHGKIDQIHDLYRENLLGFGQQSNFKTASDRFFSGIIKDVSNSGLLMVEEADKITEYAFKEVFLLNE